MGSSSHRDTSLTITMRYAPYVENHHHAFLDTVHSKTLAIADDSPYTDYIPIEVDDAFFSTGYVISNFSSLSDVFGKFMSGFDIEVVWDYIFKDEINKSEMNTSVASEMKLVDDDMIKNALSKFQTEMRNVNSVITSSFVIGRAMIENARVKALSKISAAAKFSIIPTVQERFIASLNWSKKLVTTYAEIMKLYYMTEMYIDETNYKFEAQDALWPFIAMDFERASLGALRASASFEKIPEIRKRSTVSGVCLVLSYTWTCAMVGSYIGGVWGAIIGAIVGIIIGIAMWLLE